MGILDWRGPEFLMLYSVLLAVLILAAVMLRSSFRPPDDKLDPFSARLRPLEIAYLVGGPAQAIEAAVTSVRYHRSRPIEGLGRGDGALARQLLVEADPLEDALYTLSVKHGGALDQAAREADTALAPVRSRLTWLKLFVSERETWRVRRVQLLAFGALLALGVTKMAVGLSRGRPVGFLGVLCVVTLALLIFFMSRPAARSRRGDRAVELLKAKNIALMWTAGQQPQRLAAADAALAVALFGGTVLGHAYATLGLHRGRVSSGGTSSCGGSSCGGGGCGGGGGGGCGGCGS